MVRYQKRRGWMINWIFGEYPHSTRRAITTTELWVWINNTKYQQGWGQAVLDRERKRANISKTMGTSNVVESECIINRLRWGRGTTERANASIIDYDGDEEQRRERMHR